jgi:hypothetical protein
MNTTYPNTTVDQALLQEVEEVAERWLTGSLSEEILHAALRVLRPDLPADDRWQLWLDYTGALSEWHTAPGGLRTPGSPRCGLPAT